MAVYAVYAYIEHLFAFIAHLFNPNFKLFIYSKL